MLISGKIDQSKPAKLDEEPTKPASEVPGEELKMKRERLSKFTPEQEGRLADFLSVRKAPHARKMTGGQSFLVQRGTLCECGSNHFTRCSAIRRNGVAAPEIASRPTRTLLSQKRYQTSAVT
jgi:hypothetical protein